MNKYFIKYKLENTKEFINSFEVWAMNTSEIHPDIHHRMAKEDQVKYNNQNMVFYIYLKQGRKTKLLEKYNQLI